MSQERRARQKEKATVEERPGKRRQFAIYAVLIVVVFAVAYYFFNRAQHKYDGFAHCLSDRGVKMYGAWWCPHCQDQKQEFKAAFEYVPYVECGIPGNLKGQNPVCKDAGITHFPTWQFPPTGERLERVFSLEELSDRTGCPLP